MLADTKQEQSLNLFQSSAEDMATLGSDQSAAEGRTTERASRRPGKRSPWSANLSYSSSPTSLDAVQSVKPDNYSSLLPLLDQIETSLQTNTTRSFPTLSRVRDSIVEECITLFAPEEWDRLERIAKCSSDMVVIRDGTNYRVSPALCRDRLCPICNYYRSVKLKRKLRDTIKRMRKPKLLTLTLKQSTDQLEVQARRLTKCFARLRRRQAFMSACRSGFWVLEYTFRPDSRTWHVHIHAVIDAHYIAHEAISSMWLSITGDSFVVDIRKANPNHAGYLAKYVAKNGMFLPPREQLLEYLRSVKSVRMFGSWGGLRITEDSVLDLGDCRKIGLLSEIIQNARDGWKDALWIVLQLSRNLPAWPENELNSG